MKSLLHKLNRALRQLIVLALLCVSLPPSSTHAQTDTPQEPSANHKVYLPLVAAPPGPPDFFILSPSEGLTIAGTSFFAIQSPDLTNISKVSFQAGSIKLGTDSTRADGFQVYLDSSKLPVGKVKLTATATNSTGKTTTKSINVTVVAKPPSSSTVGATGTTLGTVSGNTIIVPPGAVGAGTTVSITDKTQAQVTQEQGINWDSLGVTFLGAIDVKSSSEITKPLGVSSVGFGNRVQPGQALVTYQIMPDADGDGVGELIVVNGANLAPNGTIVSSAIPKILVNKITVQNSAQVNSSATVSTIQGPPGTIIRMEVNGFNVGSVIGNVAVFHSLVNGKVIEIPSALSFVSDDPSAQIFTTVIPPLPVGAATLMLRNNSTGEEKGLFDVSIIASDSLSRAPDQILDEFFTKAIALTNRLNVTEPSTQLYRDQLVTNFTEIRKQIPQLVVDSKPEVQQLLKDMATIIYNSGLLTLPEFVAVADANKQDPDEKRILDMFTAMLGVITAVGGAVILFGGGAAAFPILAPILAVIAIDIAIFKAYQALEDGLKPCSPSLLASLANSISGMGSAPPPGGDGCGNVANSGSAGLVQSAGVPMKNELIGRFTIKVFRQTGNGNALTPFTGSTDPGGYFYIPLIAQGEPFKAVATDNVTGASIVVTGTGPAVGKSVMMFFDFYGAKGNRYDIKIGDTITNGVPSEGAGNIEEPGGLDIYRFQGTAGQQVYLDWISYSQSLHDVDWVLLAPDGKKVDGSYIVFSDGVIDLPQTGIYKFQVGDDADPGTGIYSFKLWNVPPPHQFNIKIGDTITNGVPSAGAGNIETPGVKDIYRFQGTAGQQVYLDWISYSQSLHDVDWVLLAPDGKKVDGSYIVFSDGVIDLPQTGIYKFQVGDDTDPGTGIYSFKLWNVPPPHQFNIKIGDTITNGVPSAGAGNIETPGVKDIYRFQGTAGQQVYLDWISYSQSLHDVDWVLLAPDGKKVDGSYIYSSDGVIDLPQTGIYKFHVGDDTDPGTGTYSFRFRKP